MSCHLYLKKETEALLAATSFQGVAESLEVSPQPPLLQIKPPQFPQWLLTTLVFQSLHQFRCPSLHMLKQLKVLLRVRGPQLNTTFEVRSPQGRAADKGQPRVLMATRF